MSYSICCGAHTTMPELGICPDCQEHCDWEDEEPKERISHTTIANYGNLSFEQWSRALKVSSAYIKQNLHTAMIQDDKQEIRFNEYFKNKKYD